MAAPAALTVVRFGLVGSLVGLAACATSGLPMARRLNRGEAALVFTVGTMLAGVGVISLRGVPAGLAAGWLSLPSIEWMCLADVSVLPRR